MIAAYKTGLVANTAAAHDAVRGVKKPEELLIANAKRRAGRLNSPYERALMEALGMGKGPPEAVNLSITISASKYSSTVIV